MITKASGPFPSETGKGCTPAARRKLDEILEHEKIRTDSSLSFPWRTAAYSDTKR